MSLTKKKAVGLTENAERTEALQNALRVGVVQTVIKGDSWLQYGWRMDAEAAATSWRAIERAFQQFHVLEEPPEIVLLPEVSVPRAKFRLLKKMSAGLPCLTVAGLDFELSAPRNVANRAALLVPTRWPDENPSRGCKVISIGKTYPSEEEREMLRKNKPKRRFAADPTLWLFDAGHLGRFGVCLCYDFMDVDRLPLYRGEIHHLFVLAYNRDIVAFNHLAESLCRTLYCNVVVCNTGFFGSSAAMTPHARHYRRPTYRVQGQRLETSQIISLPVEAIDIAQRTGDRGSKGSYDELKGIPPGLPKNSS